MYNTIRKLNMVILYESICDLKPEMSEDEIEKMCVNLEDSPEFKKMFFFQDECDYYCHSDNVNKIRELVNNSLNIDVTKIFDDCCEEYGTFLNNTAEDKDIEISSKYIGKLIINKDSFYNSLEEEFLRNNEIINRLVKAKDFYSEMEQIKKECLEYLINMLIDDIKEKVREFKFD